MDPREGRSSMQICPKIMLQLSLEYLFLFTRRLQGLQPLDTQYTSPQTVVGPSDKIHVAYSRPADAITLFNSYPNEV